MAIPLEDLLLLANDPSVAILDEELIHLALLINHLVKELFLAKATGELTSSSHVLLEGDLVKQSQIQGDFLLAILRADDRVSLLTPAHQRGLMRFTTWLLRT